MKDTYVLSFDLGTSGMKMSLVDRSLHVVDVVKRDYDFQSPKPEWAQVNPSIFIQSITETVQLMHERRKKEMDCLCALVFCTQWKGLIPVDERGSALYDAILWLDKRAQPQAKNLNDKLGFNAYTAADCIPKIIWLRENLPEIYERTYRFLEINSFIKCFATGVMVIDETEHYGKSFIDEIQKHMDAAIKISEIPHDKIPNIIHSNDVAGALTQQAASTFGLLPGLPVYGGLCDIPAVALGSAAFRVGQSHIYLGSSGWLATILPTKELPRCKRTAVFLNDSIIRLDGLEAVGLARKWALNLLFTNDQINDERFIKMLDDSIDSSQSNLLSIPLIYQENPPLPEKVFGVFWHMTASDEKKDFYHAVLEGICYLIRYKLESLTREFEYEYSELTVCGGGATNYGWIQMLSNITKKQIQIVSNPQYVGTIGSAALIFKDVVPSNETFSDIGQTFKPDTEKMLRFDKKYLEFLRIYNMVVANEENITL
ncbi:MAG: FGGY family carbohydrate kinase [Sphaerochaetaceae bacterium]